MVGILPSHAPLVTTLQPGELRVKKGADEVAMAVGGGFLEVAGNRVLVLADTAERADEIDMARAEEARRRAEEARQNQRTSLELAAAEAALRLSLIRLQVARRRARGGPGQR
jgi:F-type H+-transporting ATPase subunit epsilon